MRKIWIFISLLFVFILPRHVFWYLESSMYCNFENNNVTIFVKNEGWMAKCQTYLDTLYQLALKKYNEISAIYSYIDQWDDVYYWMELLGEKKTEFIQLVNYRVQIKTAIERFELALFVTYYEKLKKPMQAYLSDLEAQYYELNNQSYPRNSSFYLKLAQ